MVSHRKRKMLEVLCDLLSPSAVPVLKLDPRALSSGPHGASSPSLPGLQRPPTLVVELELSNTGNINTPGV